MFNKLFGTNTNFDSESTTNAKDDAESIQNTSDYFVLRSAWDEYVTIKSKDEDYLYGDATPTPAWQALDKVQEYEGDFMKFTGEEQHLLRALKKGFLIYADVLHVLIDHHGDEDAASDLFRKYPELHDHIPPEYDNTKYLIEVLIEIVKDYQWQLEHFSIKHINAINEALKSKKDEASPRRSVVAKEKNTENARRLAEFEDINKGIKERLAHINEDDSEEVSNPDSLNKVQG